MQHWKSAFLTIVAGQTVSLIGSAAVQFSMIWWLSTKTNSPLMLALAGLAAFVPQLILGPFAGVWIDRMKRKRVVIAADLFMGTVAALFSLCFLFTSPPAWSVCLVLGIRAVGTVFHTPAMQALVPLLVPREELVRANGWSQFFQSGAFMLGPVLGGIMFSALPMWLILLTDFAGALVASACLAWVRIAEPTPAHTQLPHFGKEWKEGIVPLLQDQPLFIITIAATLCMIFFLPISSYYPLMSSGYFAVSSLYGSLVEVLYATGMMLAALIIGWVGTIRHKFLWIHLGLLGTGLFSLLCGLLPPDFWAFWLFAVFCSMLGGFTNLYNILYLSYLQQTIAAEKQGRVFSIIGTLSAIAMPIGLVLSAPIAEQQGVSSWFVIAGVATLCFILLSALLLLYWHQRSKNAHKS